MTKVVKKMNFNQINAFLEDLESIADIPGNAISDWYEKTRLTCAEVLKTVLDKQEQTEEFKAYRAKIDEIIQEKSEGKELSQGEKIEIIQAAHKELEETELYKNFDKKIKEIASEEYEILIPKVQKADIVEYISGRQRIELKKIAEFLE